MSFSEISAIVQHVIENNHRAILVLKNTQILPHIFTTLCKKTVGQRPQLLYLHSSSVEKVEFEEENLVETVRFRDSNKILGNTFGMLVVQDFEQITANLLAKSVETVKGGGLCCFVLDSSKNMSGKLFFRRLFKILSKSENAYFFDENNKLVDAGTKKRKKIKRDAEDSNRYKNINNNSIQKIATNNSKSIINNSSILNSYETVTNNSKSIINNNSVQKIDTNPLPGNQTLSDEVEANLRGKLLDLSKTNEQRVVLQSLYNMFTERSFKTVCSLSAARGRGKSAVMGLGISLALHCSFSTVLVAAPCIENVTTLFEFIVLGLQILGYQQKVHFDLHYKTCGKRRLVCKITFRKRFLRQEVSYFYPGEELNYLPDLMVIDEAAAMPLPQINKLLKCNLVIMASTIDGYEGTGRVLAVKLFSELERKSLDNSNPFLFKRLALECPIRYSENDPIENWLNCVLILYSQPLKVESCPSLENTNLYFVNKEILFSGNKVAETFLTQVASLFSASHYKNSPNDLQEISDNENLNVFVLTANKVEDNLLPPVICAIELVDEKIADISNKSGNLTPFCLFENYGYQEALKLTGKRIIRIAVHPELQRMGYGNHAIKILIHKVISSYTINKLSKNTQNEEFCYKCSCINHTEFQDTFSSKIEPIATKSNEGLQNINDSHSIHLKDTNAMHFNDTNTIHLRNSDEMYLKDTNAMNPKNSDEIYKIEPIEIKSNEELQNVNDTNAMYNINPDEMYLKDTNAMYLKDTNAMNLKNADEMNLKDTNTMNFKDTNAVHLKNADEIHNKNAEEVHNKILNTLSTSKSLLTSIESLCMGYCEYISVSFGATNQLISFWKKNEFKIAHVKAHPSSTTGEYSALYLHTFLKNNPLFSNIYDLFRRKFVLNTFSFYKKMDYNLFMNLFYHDTLQIQYPEKILGTDLDAESINSILLFLKGKFEFRHIAHFMSILAKNYFLGYYKVILTPIEQSILLLVGIQSVPYEKVYKIIGIEGYKVESKMIMLITKLYDEYNQ